eukprot:SAG11_NODE_112_length_16156_cov_22.455191_6_plen_286_part_00
MQLKATRQPAPSLSLGLPSLPRPSSARSRTFCSTRRVPPLGSRLPGRSPPASAGWPSSPPISSPASDTPRPSLRWRRSSIPPAPSGGARQKAPPPANRPWLCPYFVRPPPPSKFKQFLPVAAARQTSSACQNPIGSVLKRERNVVSRRERAPNPESRTCGLSSMAHRAQRLAGRRTKTSWRRRWRRAHGFGWTWRSRGGRGGAGVNWHEAASGACTRFGDPPPPQPFVQAPIRGGHSPRRLNRRPPRGWLDAGGRNDRVFRRAVRQHATPSTEGSGRQAGLQGEL